MPRRRSPPHTPPGRGGGAPRRASARELLRRVGRLIEERVYDIAAALTLEVGKNRMEALGEAQEAADFFYTYCDDFERAQGFEHALPNDPLSGHVSRNRSVLKPYGAWVVITPFNFPLALAAGPVAAALITGNTVVLKGASATPWAGRLLADCIRDAGVPRGRVQLPERPERLRSARTLVDHPLTAGVTFTGSYEVGRQIALQAAGRALLRGPCIAEMGGKNACIVTARPISSAPRPASSAPPSAWAVRNARRCRACTCSGEVADALHRAGCCEQCAALKIGDPARRENWLGPVTTQSGYDDYARYSATAAHQRCAPPHRRRAAARRRPGARLLRAADARGGAAGSPAVAAGDVPADPHAAPGRSGNEEAMRLANASRARADRRLLRRER